MNLNKKQIKSIKELINKIILYLNSSYFQSFVAKKKLNKIQIPNKRFSQKKISNLINNYFESTVSTHHPHFFNQLFSGFDFESFLAEMIISVTNTSMYTFEVAPIQTLIEIELLNKITAMVGFPLQKKKINGTFVSGGSNANLVALTVARESLKKKKLDKLRVYISEHAHYSFEKAMIISGIGVKNLVKVKSNSKGQIDKKVLEQEINYDIQKKKIPFFIGATAGTTVLGSFDDISSLSKVAEKYQLWLHVDGALGGSVIFSQKYKKLLNGISKADSFCFDAHKMLGVSLICSVLIFKKEEIFQKATKTKVDYLFHRDEWQEDFSQDLGEYSFQCGRKTEAVKLWLAWCANGNFGYQKRIENFFFLAEWTGKEIQNNKNLQLIYHVFSVNICFRFVSEKVNNELLNKINLEIRQNLIAQNRFMINFTKEKINDCEILFLRLVIIHPKLNKKIIKIFLKEVVKQGENLIKKIIV